MSVSTGDRGEPRPKALYRTARTRDFARKLRRWLALEASPHCAKIYANTVMAFDLVLLGLDETEK